VTAALDASPLSALASGPRSDQHAGDGRRHERPRYRPLAELGKHDRQLEDAEALPTNRFGECNPCRPLEGGGIQ
jgi:hypothetical protein